MPRLDANAEAAFIGRWLVAPGDAVSAGQPIAEIVTDKATYEFEAECDGVIRWQAPAKGTPMPAGYVIALLAGSGDEPLPDVAGENAALMGQFLNSPLGFEFAQEAALSGGPPAGPGPAPVEGPSAEPMGGEAMGPGAGRQAECLIPLQTEGRGAPLFFITPARAGHLRPLARHMGRDRPFYALQSIGAIDPQSPWIDIRELAGRYVDAIRRAQPQGPYLLAGVSSGGVVALEVAHQLYGAGEEVGLLAVVDALSRPTMFRPFGGILGMLRRQPAQMRMLRKAPVEQRVAAVRALAEGIWKAIGPGRLSRMTARRGPGVARQRGRRTLVKVVDAHRYAAARYRLEPFPGRIVYFWSVGS